MAGFEVDVRGRHGMAWGRFAKDTEGRTGQSWRRRLRYWLNSFRGFAVLDLRGTDLR